MSYTDLLIDTCDVEEDTPGLIDNYGIPAETWTVLLDDEPCRLQDVSGREVTVGAEVVIADYKLFLGDVEVTEQHRIVMGGVTYEILSVTDKKDGLGSHHKEVYLRTVR